MRIMTVSRACRAAAVVCCAAWGCGGTPERHGAPWMGGDAGVAGVGGSGGGSGGTGLTGAVGASGGNAGAQNHRLVDFLGDAAYPDDHLVSLPVAESGIDSSLMESAVDRIETAGWEIHSLLVVHRGALVFERYGWNTGTNPDDPATPHQVVPDERHLQWSATKSVLSALIGIAIEVGDIPGVDEPVAGWFADYDDLDPSPEKSLITLEDLLTMRSGLQCTEGDQTTFTAPDPARAVFARPVVDTPVGEVWNYCTGVSDIVAEVLRAATGATPLEYAQQALFGPLGIVDPTWEAGQNGMQYGGFGLALTSREMARFGELYRNDGRWGDEQLVPSAWVDVSTASHTPTAWGRDYGYHWWVSNIPGGFNAFGAHGQEIFVLPEREVVVVFTADLPTESAETIFEELLRDYVLPALPS